VQSVLEPPSAQDLLTAWELGLSCPPAQRAVVLLDAVLPQHPVDELLELSVRACDEQLIEAHRELFGARLWCVVTCPSCGAELELELPVEELLAVEDESADIDVDVAGWAVHGRSLTVGDLLDAAAATDAAAARALLLTRAVVSASSPAGAPAAPCELPAEVEAALAAELDRRNPTGALEIEQTCPECGRRSRTPFDAVSYLWTELEAWAQRTLHEIHTLARAYGWREHDILALGARRRAAYLELAGHE
jgi:hypothetical protein